MSIPRPTRAPKTMTAQRLTDLRVILSMKNPYAAELWNEFDALLDENEALAKALEASLRMRDFVKSFGLSENGTNSEYSQWQRCRDDCKSADIMLAEYAKRKQEGGGEDFLICKQLNAERELNKLRLDDCLELGKLIRDATAALDFIATFVPASPQTHAESLEEVTDVADRAHAVLEKVDHEWERLLREVVEAKAGERTNQAVEEETK